MPVSAAQRAHRARLRSRRWKSMSAPALMALKERLDARGIPVPAVMWEHLRLALKGMRLDPVYRAAVQHEGSRGRPLPRPRFTNSRGGLRK